MPAVTNADRMNIMTKSSEGDWELDVYITTCNRIRRLNYRHIMNSIRLVRQHKHSFKSDAQKSLALLPASICFRVAKQ